MQMRPKIYLKSKLNYAVLHWYEKREVWLVYEYCKYGIDALSVAQYRSMRGEGKMVLAERNAGSVMIHEGKIVDYNWNEWEVVWKR